MDKLKSILKRFGRGSLAVVLAGIPAYFSNDPKYILLAPVINAAGKWLRSAFGLKNIPF